MGNLFPSLRYLRENRVKKGDSVESAARSERMNALSDAILSLARGDHMRKGPGIYLKTSEGMVIISTRPEEGGGGGAATEHPFKVSVTSKDSYTAIQVSPGLIMNQVPYIEGALMNQLVFDGQGQLVPNTFTPPNEDFSVWLITRIKNDFDNYHPRIDIAEPGEVGYVPIKPPHESCYITHVAPALEDRIDFRIKWDTGTEKTAGGFPIKLADIKVGPPPAGVTTGPVVKSITQYVFESWRSLILVENDVVPIG